MDEISIKRALVPPAMLALVTFLIAAALSLHTGVSGYRVYFSYISGWTAASLLSIMVWVFVEVARLAPTGADRPLQIVLRRLGQPSKRMLLSAVIFPAFIASYTWAKCSIPFVVGYDWERTWANADFALFGMDAWRWAHAIMPPAVAPAWSFFYSVIWGMALMFGGTFVAAFASDRFAATYFTAMMLSWLIGGIVMAYSISAAGPVFAHLVDPDLGQRFLPLRAELSRILSQDDMVLKSQRYLATGMQLKVALIGRGVSAMPSMHIATVTILVLAAWRSWWLAPALLFALLTFFGSVYLGYHYAVDAPVAVVVAAICWAVARRIYSAPGLNPVAQQSNEAPRLQQPAGCTGL